MMKSTRRGWMAMVLVAGAGLAGADEAQEEGVALTVYNQGFAVVKARRKMELKAGIQDVLFTDVAASIDPTSVKFESLTDPDGTRVLEQNYQYDLVDQNKLLQKYVDREVAFEVLNEQSKALERKPGTLLSVGGIVRMGSEIRLGFPGAVLLPALPEGLITRPTLQWKLDARKAGAHMAKVTYQASRISWHADYTLVAKKDDTLADLSGWVTIDNQTGASYPDARIKLMAGDVHRVEEPRARRALAKGADLGESQGVGGFEEKAFAEYHLYTLGRPATVKESETKQIELMGATDVPSTKTYRYDANQDPKKVRVLLGFENRKESRLGMPLPAGKIRVYKQDEADGSLEFVGEDRVAHTPKDEKVELYIGDAFDLVGERTQLDVKKHPKHLWQTFRIALRNHKESGPVKVEVVEHPGAWANWEVEKKSDDFVKKDAGTIVFAVDVPKDGEKVVEYTLHSWTE